MQNYVYKTMTQRIILSIKKNIYVCIQPWPESHHIYESLPLGNLKKKKK